MLGLAVASGALNVLGMGRLSVDTGEQQNQGSTRGKAEVASAMPWPSVVDEKTGRRVYRLTGRPGNNMAFYYMFQNQGAVGDVPYLVYRNSLSESGGVGGITYYSINLNTGEEVELTQRGMVGSIADVRGEYMYCMEREKRSDRFYSYIIRSHLATGVQERLFDLNTQYKHSANLSVSADEAKVLFIRPGKGRGITLLCGIIADKTQHVIASGKMSHIQFGPVDPDLYVYIDEGYGRNWKRAGFGWADFSGGIVTNASLVSSDPFFLETNGDLIPSHLHWTANGQPVVTAVDTEKPYVKEYNVVVSPDKKHPGKLLGYKKVQIRMGEFQTHFNPASSPDEFVGDGKSADWWHKPGFGKPFIHKLKYDYAKETMTQIPLADQIGSFWKSGEYEACARYVPGKDIVVWNAFRTLAGDIPEYPTGGEEKAEGWLYHSANPVKQNVFAVSYRAEDGTGWDFSADTEGWTASNLTEFAWSDGGFDAACIQGEVGAGEAALFSPDSLDLPCKKYPRFFIRLKNGSPSKTCTVYFSTDQCPDFSKEQSVQIPILSQTNGYVSYYADLSKNAEWNGTLKQLKVCPAGGAGSGRFSIQVMRLLDSTGTTD